MNPTGSKSIICTKVPASLLKKAEAKHYFQEFGPVLKIVVKPKSQKCIVEYETIEAAENALNLGGEYQGIEFPIEYQIKSASKRKPAKAKKDPDPDWDLEPEVKAELEAMGTTGIKKQYNLRPEKMMVDPGPLKIDRKMVKRERDMKKPAVTTGKGGKVQSGENDLLNILRQRALSTEDKYRTLEARDKLIRLRRSKVVHVLNIKATVGTCPDMCPEKERLMRIVQHQVSLYEQEIGERTMNHYVAVKQYSRSSADQETPLPHELRNVDVLQMTMGYLMHRIMHLCDAPDVNLAEWFHFLWDRMRGIRKDITQQELCSLGSVELVEQCARFHIHCSARLVAEDPSVFDQRINTENLTKCLQTLKYMYHDLAVKGERCPNEAEFRAYVILLNLNDGNFMWEVQQLQPEIQCSPEVKFALAVYSSLDKNNFVRFFKLVRQTTYLNACILLRYFIQVRTKALRTVVQCYTPRLPHANFPIAQLINMLAFEGRSSAIDFLEHYSLSISDDQNFVMLNKRNFTLPDMPYVLDRAVNVIESKRAHSVGEVVCGAALPEPFFEDHEPQNSFDAEGYLVNLDAYGLGDVAKQPHLQTVQETTPLTARDEVDRMDVYKFRDKERSNSPFSYEREGSRDSREAWPQKSTSLGIFGSFAPQVPKPPSYDYEQQRQHLEQELEKKRVRKEELEEKARQERHLYELRAQQVREREEYERQQQILREIQQEQEEEQQRIIDEARRMALERHLEAERVHVQQMKQEEERQRRVEEQRVVQQRRETEAKQKHEAQQRHLAAEQEKLHLAEITKSVRHVMDNLLTKVEHNYRTERLAQLRDNSLCRFALLKWRKRVLTNRRKRKAIDQGPLWLSRVTTSKMAEELYTSNQNQMLNMMKRYKSGVATTCKPKQRAKIDRIDIHGLAAHALVKNSMRRLQNDIYWKIGIFYDTMAIVDKTVNAAIGWDARKALLKHVKENQNTFTYSVARSHLEVDDLNGLMIVVDSLSETLIDTLLKFLNKLGDKVFLPVCFILQEYDQRLVDEVRALCEEHRLISERKVTVCHFTSETLSDSLKEGVVFLAEHFRAPPSLKLNTLRAFLLENLGSDLWQRVRSFAKWNLSYKQCVSKPIVAIGLFNEAIDRLKSVVSDEQRAEFPNFPKIFNDFLPNQIPDYLPCDFKYFPAFWKSPQYTQILLKTLDKFKLPVFEASANSKWPLEVSHYESQHALEEDIMRYCEVLFKFNKDKAATEKVFYRLMAKLLDTSLGWIDIVEVLLEEKLKTIDLVIPDVYKAHTVFNQLFVVYQQEQLQAYLNSSWFYLKNDLVQREIDIVEEITQEADTSKIIMYEDEAEDVDLHLDAAMKLIENDDDTDDDKRQQCKAAFDDFKTLMDDLEKSISIQQQISKRFQSNLKCYLQED